MSNNPIDYTRLDPMVGVDGAITNSPYYLGSNRRLQKQAEALAQEQQYVPIRYGKVETIDPNAQAGRFIRPDSAPYSYNDALSLYKAAAVIDQQNNDAELAIAKTNQDRVEGKYDEYGNIDTPYATVEEAQAVAAALPRTPDGIYTTKTRTRTQTRVKAGSGQRRKPINYGRSK